MSPSTRGGPPSPVGDEGPEGSMKAPSYRAWNVRLGEAPESVAPCGSAEATPMNLSNTSRYSLQGGGPALGALYGAVNASPSSDAGQPLMLYDLTSASSVGPSVTF